MKKYFVLDTNVLLHSAESLLSFDDNDVVIPIQVIEELDRFKKQTDEKGRNARKVARILDGFREEGSLLKGSKINDAGGTLRVLVDFDVQLPEHFSPNVLDNQILAAARYLLNTQKRQKNKRDVIFVSKDLNARIKADTLGIKTADYEASKINFDELYKGWREIAADEEMLYTLKSQGSLPWTGAFPNEYFLFTAEREKLYARYHSAEKCVRLLPDESVDAAPWNIRAMNPQQVFALDALLDEEIRLVTLVGKAGTGKTLLALAAGLQKTIDDLSYKRILVSRPIMPMGRDIGFLPGNKDEKLSHWMQPVFDNLSFIFDNSVTDGLPSDHLDFLMKNEKISLEALTYIRGRSIAHQWLIVDEAQNLTPHEIKTIITRVGKGTKIVLTGDPYQIDNPYLDPSSNGLTVVVERFKDQNIFGNLVLQASERSYLSSLAAELL